MGALFLKEIIFVLLLLQQSSKADPTDSCDDAFALTFEDSTIEENELQFDDGRLRYESVGSYEGETLNLEVTDIGGNPYTLPNRMNKWTPNGLKEGMGKIGVNYGKEEGKRWSGRHRFKFCLTDSDWKPKTVDSWTFTFFDIDQRGPNTGPLEERLEVPVRDFDTYQVTSDSDLDVSCVKGGVDKGAPPCAAKDRLKVASTEKTDKNDNPLDPNDLDEDQMKKSISFQMKDKSCFRVYLHVYCDGSKCLPNGKYKAMASFFLFAGKANQMCTLPLLSPK